MAVSGFLSRAISWVRKYTDEPAINAKYTDSQIIELIQESFSEILDDVNRLSQHPLTVRYDITISNSSQEQKYCLPPNISAIQKVTYLDSSGNILNTIVPVSKMYPLGPGFEFQPGMLIVDKGVLSDGCIVRVEYVPSGAALLHEGSVETPDEDEWGGDYIVLAASPSVGSLDTHANAYAGSMLRILTVGGSDAVQERFITSYDSSSRRADLAVPFQPEIPSKTAITYEICPPWGGAIDATLVGAHAALNIVTAEGDITRAKALTSLYARKMRALRLRVAGFYPDGGIVLSGV